MDLKTPLKSVLKTTSEYLSALESMDILTVGDLLQYLPRSHEDISGVHTLAQTPLDTKVTLRGIVDDLKLVRTRTGKQLVTGTFVDQEGSEAQVVWFNQPHIKRMLADGTEVVLTGKLTINGNKLQIQSPQFEKDTNRPAVHGDRLVPVYPQHDVITTKWLREKMILVKDAISLIPEDLPDDVLKEESLPSKSQMIQYLHFPENADEVQKAYDRLSFEKMYDVQLQALARKKEWQEGAQDRLRTPMDIELIRALFASLKFTPTNSQKIAIYEILRDMEKEVPMSRLLEGDVGSGKTLVAVAVMANTVRQGGQAALMVPTEVLARQHAEGISKLLFNFHTFMQTSQEYPLRDVMIPRVALLTGSTPKGEGDEIKQKLATGMIDIIIGTHSLIEDSVQFKDLRLVIVDEQHRFGVTQRAKLRDKGNPHFLSMTATPIPRTLALTAYGDHDLSVLLEKPGRRQSIHTKVVPPSERVTIERFIDQQIDQGRQVFVICPLISESEELDDVRNVTRESERLRGEFPHRTISMLHGKLKPKEKQEIMQEFRDKKADILVSTSVIEVGIDIPNATIIVIEGSERFGLAQLHQLRGRVGRGDEKSYCFLFTTSREQAYSPRLKAMEQHESGFMLAEIDMKIRGPGELFGLRQSGIPESQIATFLQPELIARARRAAERALGMAPTRTFDSA